MRMVWLSLVEWLDMNKGEKNALPRLRGDGMGIPAFYLC
jgi:hypothetical protein